tara:strand:- start:1647 stop:2069 length:423 start_codon:yes stop_codon:yes gene_type:complete
MIINEFISESNKNQMIAKILKYYGVGRTKLKHKVMKNHAHYEVEEGVLYLSTKYKVIKPSQLKEFLITIIHETYHAVDAKKYGWKKFRDMWELEANKIEQGFYKGKSDGYWDNPYEVAAEKFGQANWRKWKTKFKKEKLI